MNVEKIKGFIEDEINQTVAIFEKNTLNYQVSFKQFKKNNMNYLLVK
jgi:hypothetical protein